MTTFFLSDAAAQFGGTLLNPDAKCDSFSIDSRKIKHGDIFVALSGEHYDGHEFIDGIANEIAGAIVTKPVFEKNFPQWVVKDSEKALGCMASLKRNSFKGQTIAITGSSGKTTVKEFIFSILKLCGSVHATEGNLNNQIGLPLTLLALPEGTDYLVLEMGARKAGDINYLCSLSRPDISLVNNIQNAHIGSFGDLGSIANAKSEIYRSLPEHGVGVLNLDLDYSNEWKNLLGPRRCITFSAEDESADVLAINLKSDEHGCYKFDMRLSPSATTLQDISIELNVPGEHSVGNAIAAAACALAAGAGIDQIKQGLQMVEPISGRLMVKKLRSGGSLIDDSYNANPESVKAAINFLSTRPGIRIFVFGDMADLGNRALEFHCSVGDYALDSGIDAMLTLGCLSAHASKQFNGQHFSSLDALRNYLSEFKDTSGLTFLVKGSRSSSMEKVVFMLDSGEIL
ncbi:MAG: hypothetical protein CBC09_04320 [Cellvibrionales bacterium TMED49]|nr:UDP-N-acetylmuramoyl-tripeptide--D-alanyl-D-alanine ligase [Porticoccaceae bacterium]OUU38848.1 MAG: hypothetical protein CBC09_04320 [Cellvibrionales bacterium TMED49]